MTMMMAPSKAVLAGRVDVGEVSNGEVRDGAHMGDVASAAIDSPRRARGRRGSGRGRAMPAGAAVPLEEAQRVLAEARARGRRAAPRTRPCHNRRFAIMPKMKTHSGAKKRFKVTATGKVRGRHPFTSHILEKKSPKRKRALGRPAIGLRR